MIIKILKENSAFKIPIDISRHIRHVNKAVDFVWRFHQICGIIIVDIEVTVDFIKLKWKLIIIK